MKKTIKVVGLGQRRTGTSNGRSYDFVPVSFVYNDEQFSGLRAATSNIDVPMIEERGGIKVNDEIVAIFHFKKNTIYIDGLI